MCPRRCAARIPKSTPGSKICFVSGLAIVNGTVYVSYGAGDGEAWLWGIEWPAFQRWYMQPSPPTSPPDHVAADPTTDQSPDPASLHPVAD